MMGPDYTSRFRYSLERPYPFRWFTPMVTVSGIIAVVLFSFVNIAADGYVQSVVYTTSPNSTLDEHHWYGYPPWSWISTAQSSCQSPGISIGSFYYTSNQEAGSYTVTNMNTTLAPNEDAIYPGVTSKTLGITTYLNNTLRDCTMGDITVIFTSQQQPSSATLMIQTGPVYCYIDAERRINITVEQSFSGTEFLFAQRSSLSQWSVYNFMKSSYDALMNAVHAMNSTSEYTGTTIDLTTSGNAADITADGFFSASILSPGQSANLVSSPDNSTSEPFALAQGQPEDLSRLLDAFAKSYYSTVMWDLNFDQNNAFSSENTTQYLTTAINAVTGNDTIVSDPILGSSDLVGSPAQFEIQYLCSVPRKKDLGSLIISVVVADIVLLSVFWSIFNWVALRYLRRRDPNWNICPGCLHLSNPRLMSQTNARIMTMDQDPLCQNVDIDQETLCNNLSGQDGGWKSYIKPGRDGHSIISSRSSQRTLRALSEESMYPGHHNAKEYISLA